VSLADRMLGPRHEPTLHLLGTRRMLVWPLQHPQPFDPADHDRRQQVHDELAACVLENTDQEA